MRLSCLPYAAGVAALLALGAMRALAEPPQGPARSAWAPRAAVSETEPNNTPATADEVANADTVTGTLSTWDDVDYFALPLTVGALLTLDLTSASPPSYYFYASLTLMDTTGAIVLRYAEYASGKLHLEFPVSATGRYYARVSGYYSGISYVLTVGIEPPGPGDPTTVFADSLGVPSAMAADRTGHLLVIDQAGQRVVRVTSDGEAETWITLPAGSYASDIALDGLGDVLLAGESGGAGIVWRYAHDTKARSRFISLVQEPTAIAVGPDGDIWVAGYGRRLWRFDPGGAVKDSVQVPYTGSGIFDIAFSPKRDLYYTSGSTVWRLSGRESEAVIEGLGYYLGLAFDREGNLYVAHNTYTSGGSVTTVRLFNPNHEQIGSAFARSNLLGAVHLAFARDAFGATTSNLLAANSYYYYYYGYGTPPAGAGAIVAMNPSGVRAAGWPVGVDFLIFTSAARPGIVGAPYADTLRVSGTTGAAVWIVATGALPPGLTLDSLSGRISGTPERAGRFGFTVQARVSDRKTFRDLIATVTEPELRVTDAIDALMGVPDLLTPELERFLDLKGNRNGKFDVGDLQAYLRANGRLPQAPVAVPNKEEP